MGVVREVKRGAFTSYLNTLLYCWGLFLFGWFAFFFFFLPETCFIYSYYKNKSATERRFWPQLTPNAHIKQREVISQPVQVQL